jgi:hypothetical protein
VGAGQQAPGASAVKASAPAAASQQLANATAAVSGAVKAAEAAKNVMKHNLER